MGSAGVCRSRLRWLGEIAVAAGLCGLGGCSPFHDGYHYVPRPATLMVPGAERPEARLFVAVIGIRRADAKTKQAEAVELRLRVENTGTAPIVLSENDLQLIAGDLTSFPTPHVSPHVSSQVSPDVIEAIAPGETCMITALFAMPEGKRANQVDLESVTLTFSLRLGDERAEASTTFHNDEAARRRGYSRRYYYYGSPYHDGRGFCD